MVSLILQYCKQRVFVSTWQLCNTNILNLDPSRHLWEHSDISIRDVPVRFSSSFPFSSPARDRENMIFSTSIVLKNTICFATFRTKSFSIKTIFSKQGMYEHKRQLRSPSGIRSLEIRHRQGDAFGTCTSTTGYNGYWLVLVRPFAYFCQKEYRIA